MSKDYYTDLPYKEAKIYFTKDATGKPSTGKWYIYFFYKIPNSSPATWQMFKKTQGINRIKNLKHRMVSAKTLCNATNQLLQQKFNPFDEVEANSYTLKGGHERYLTEHVSKLKGTTYSTVKSALKYLTDYYTVIRNPDVLLNEVTKAEIIAALNYSYKKHDWGNRQYNNVLARWRGFFNWIMNEDERLVQKNPTDKISFERVYATDIFRPPTKNEFERIVNHLYANDKPLFLYAMFIYYMGYRVKETGLLQRWTFEFDTENPFIRLAAKDQKDNEDSIQFISPHLLPFLLEMGIDKLPGDYYLFARQLLPSPMMQNKIKDTVDARWKGEVIDKLGIQVKLYSLKHKQATELGEKPITDKEISMFLRHSSEETTRMYMKNKRAQVPIEFFNHQRPLPLKLDNT